MEDVSLDRRGFAVGLTLGGAALLLRLDRIARAAPVPELEFAPVIWLRVTATGRYIFILDRTEMGQGVMTALPTIFGEEFDLEPKRFEIEFATADRVYDNPDLQMQATGGSTSVHGSWIPLRRAGAAARSLFLKAAASGWNVSEKECVTADGVVKHEKSGRKAAYHELIATAATMIVDAASVPLKPASTFRYIGKSVGRFESEAKVTGKAGFGIDARVPGMRVAFVARPPRLGQVFKAFAKKDTAQALAAQHNVHSIHVMPFGVAVLANSYWQAKQAAEALLIEWHGEPTIKMSSTAMRDLFRQAVKTAGRVARDDGDFDSISAEASSERRLSATYEIPYVAHATMEPQNCTAMVKDGRCEVWAPTQSPALARRAAALAADCAEDRVALHQTLLGGGFGRRLAQDYVAEAVSIAKVAGVPVKLVWSREQDMRCSPYRPASLHSLDAVCDSKGQPLAWRHRIASQSILAQILPEWAPAMMPTWLPGFAGDLAGKAGSWAFGGHAIDDTAVEGAKELPYAIANIRVEHCFQETQVPLAFWRSVGHSYTAFVVESFVDELAAAAKADPLQYRQGLLKGAPRQRAVLEAAAARASWSKALAPGVFRGIAQHASFRSFAATVAEVSVVAGEIRVLRIVTAIDCGQVINPDLLKAQVEGATIFGLTAALKSAITFADGAVEQSNFHDYQLVRLPEAPVIEVELVLSDEPPTGVGEPGLPPVAPAVANAVFAATGTRLRALPMRL